MGPRRPFFVQPLTAVDWTTEQWIEEVRVEGWRLELAHEGIRSDRRVVMEAVRQKGTALRFASSALQSDRELVMTAVRSRGRALEYARGGLQEDREIVMAAVQQDGLALKFASPQFRSDRDVVLAAVEEFGKALQWVTEALRADRSIVFAAVLSDGCALKHVGPGLQLDEALCLTAQRTAKSSLDNLTDTRITRINPVLAKKNPFAVQGQPGTVISLTDIVPSEEAVDFGARIGLAGASVSGSIRRQATLSELAKEIKDLARRDSMEVTEYVHLVLPDDSTVDWADSEQPVTTIIPF